MKKMIVSGFGAFLDHQVNPTEWLVDQLDGQTVNDVVVQSVMLPVAFDRAADQLLKVIEKEEPAAVLMFGLAAGREAITPERVAINVMSGPLDNDGVQKKEEPIHVDGPAAYFSTLPIQKFVTAIKENGIPAAVSNTAGTYVCNCLMYRVLHYLNTEAFSIPTGFIHVPYSDDMGISGQASLSKQQMLLAAKQMLVCMTEEIQLTSVSK